MYKVVLKYCKTSFVKTSLQRLCVFYKVALNEWGYMDNAIIEHLVIILAFALLILLICALYDAFVIITALHKACHSSSNRPKFETLV